MSAASSVFYSDCTEWAGTPEARRCGADTWNLETGYPITASECFPRGTRVRALPGSSREQCRRQQESSWLYIPSGFFSPPAPQSQSAQFLPERKRIPFFLPTLGHRPDLRAAPPSCCPFPTAKTDAKPARSGPQVTLAMRKKVLYNQSVIVRDRAERAKPRAGRN